MFLLSSGLSVTLHFFLLPQQQQQCMTATTNCEHDDDQKQKQQLSWRSNLLFELSIEVALSSTSKKRRKLSDTYTVLHGQYLRRRRSSSSKAVVSKHDKKKVCTAALQLHLRSWMERESIRVVDFVA